MTTRPLTVVLFGLTGFGNTVLEALLAEDRVRVAAVFTHRYDGPFPYYDERSLIELCLERGVVCHHDVKVRSAEGLRRLREARPDLVLVATFREILDAGVLAVPPLGVVNLHPSLLPRHRGPCPTNAALLSGDDVSGVTAHYVTEALDEGDVLLQKRISIADVADDGELRQRLAGLAGDMVPELLARWRSGERPVGTPQDPRFATYAARPLPEDGFLERAVSAEAICRRVRGLNPLPGTSLDRSGTRVFVDRCVRLAGSCVDPAKQDEAIDVVIGSEAVRLFPARTRSHASVLREDP